MENMWLHCALKWFRTGVDAEMRAATAARSD